MFPTPAFTSAVPLRAKQHPTHALRQPTGLPSHGATQTRDHARRSRRAPRMISLPFRNPFAKDNSPPLALNFTTGYAYLAHPEKNTGEDAFFIQGNTVGVFDGVSGAAETRSVDPRLYSQTLAALTRDNVRELGASSVVKAAINASMENEQIGASTVCVVGMDNAGRLFGINLGDSGVRIIRNGKMIFRTKEQQHFFNCPYQLGTDSEDGIAMGQNVLQKLKAGDWMIVATDGLYDNVPDSDIVSEAVGAEDPMQLAERLGEIATQRAVDDNYRSPFMMAALKAGVEWKGGKADDITIVAVRIVDDATVEPSELISILPEQESIVQ